MNKKEISKPLAIILCIIIIFSFAFCAREYARLERAHIIAVYKKALSQKIATYHGALTAQNVDLISSWMTFDYINRIFALPSDYLKNTLAISDTDYPRIPISKYVNNHKLNEVQFIAEIKKAVSDYFTVH